METHRGSSYEIPQWVADNGSIGFVTPQSVWEGSVVFEAGKGLLYVWDGAERILYPDAHITAVTD
jgi:hypothetical protein